MRHQLPRSLALALAVLFPATYIRATAITEKVYDLSASTTSGDVVRGPAHIVVKNLNVLRYDYRFTSTIKFEATPDIWSKLTALAAPSAAPTPSPVPASAAKPKGRAAVPATAPGESSCEDQLRANRTVAPSMIHDICGGRALADDISAKKKEITVLVEQVADLRAKTLDVVAETNHATETAAAGGRAVTTFLATTDGKPASIIAGINAQLQTRGAPICTNLARAEYDSPFVTALLATWPDLSRVAGLALQIAKLQLTLDQEAKALMVFVTDEATTLGTLQRDLRADLTALEKGSVPGTKGQRDASKQEIQDILDSLPLIQRELKWAPDALAAASADCTALKPILADLGDGSQKLAAFRTAQDTLFYWKSRMCATASEWQRYDDAKRQGADPFTLDTRADCSFALGGTKSTAITLVRNDRMPGTTAGASETVLSLSVECTSVVGFSVGVAFSTIREHEFSIQPVAKPPGSTTTTNEFVSVASAGFHPLALGMVSIRLCEPTEAISLHASFGLAGNFRSDTAGGSDAEFLIGPSFALFRTMFVTPGLHIGREVSLGSGFRVGDPVPSSITSPPLHKSYKPRFGLAITFAKP